MYERFEQQFQCDLDLLGNQAYTLKGVAKELELSKLLLSFAGKSFNKGMYRIMTEESICCWNDLIGQVFPSFFQRITCFSYDWLGRIFAVDAGRLEDKRPGVVMFEPGTGEAFEIPCHLVSFHDVELIDHAEAALASRFHAEWLAAGGAIPRQDQCVGYKIPLFLGGKDEVGNLEVSDMSVYWTIHGQLIEKKRNLPLGTPLTIKR